MNNNKDGTTCVNPVCPLSMVYSPDQVWDSVYDVELALERGTLFPQLDKPFMPEVGS